jgi:chromatin assembly factor 1 subunit A
VFLTLSSLRSDLPLSAMARKAFDLLKGSFGDSISLESVTEKIKTYFTRENYISCSPADMRALDRFQDTATRMWRWEIMALDLLPDDVAAKVRKAQTARKKIRSHSRALISLLRALDDADKVLLVASSKQEQCDKLVTKVNNAEETVLKFERAAEKVRLMEEAKLKKEEIKQEKLKELHKEKDQKKEEAAKKKEELAKKKEDEKQKKMLKEAEKKNKEVSAKVSAIKKNKARLMTFFVAKESDASPKKASPVKAVLKPSTEAADYWKLLNSVEKDTKEPLFQNLSRSAKSSVRRRTKRVPVTVDVSTVDSSDPFSNQHQYAEQKTIYFPNKYKFLSFVEDYRPAYHGTWSKRSKLITGRTPFRQDKEFLNYDEDSEAEWEEGDDEMGEDLQDEAADGEEENVDEEGDTRIYNFEDGWMAEDDDVVYENEEADDETKMQRKKLKSDDVMLSEELVAPFVGGLPLVDAMKGNENIDVGDFIHVSEEKQEHAMASLQSVILTTEAEILSTDDVCLDAFPPCLVDDNFVGDPSSIGAAAQAKAPINQEMTPEDIKVFAEFVHHSTYASKDRLVEQLRTSKPNVASSRAQAQRKLDSIAVKRKNPVGGVIWEVKKGVLEKLGLEKQLAMKMPEPPKKVEPPAKAAKKPPKPKKDAMAKKDAKPPAKAKKVAKKVANAGKSVKKDEPNKVAKTVKKESDSKKRKEPPVSAASAALFANFLAGSKKPKTA